MCMIKNMVKKDQKCNGINDHEKANIFSKQRQINNP